MNKKTIIILLSTIIVLILLTKRKMKNYVIRYDRQGFGNYGAKRGTRKHNGIDIVTTPNENFSFPFAVKFVRMSYPYKDNTTLKGAVYEDLKGNTFKVFYVNPTTSKGFSTEIGTAQNVSKWYEDNKNIKGMKNHAHIEQYNIDGERINPTKTFIS